jgi:hypothetical protein
MHLSDEQYSVVHKLVRKGEEWKDICYQFNQKYQTAIKVRGLFNLSFIQFVFIQFVLYSICVYSICLGLYVCLCPYYQWKVLYNSYTRFGKRKRNFPTSSPRAGQKKQKKEKVLLNGGGGDGGGGVGGGGDVGIEIEIEIEISIGISISVLISISISIGLLSVTVRVRVTVGLGLTFFNLSMSQDDPIKWF